MSVRRQRRRARIALLQTLFEWQWHDQSVNVDKTIEWLDAEGNLNGADREYFTVALEKITQESPEFDQVFKPYLDREIEELGGVELAALRAGTHELINHQEIARAIVINEWVEVTKRFGATDSFKYINSILDKVADAVRD